MIERALKYLWILIFIRSKIDYFLPSLIIFGLVWAIDTRKMWYQK